MNTIKNDVIKLDRANKRLDAIQGGQCSKEFEEKSKKIYPPEMRQKDAEILKNCIDSKFSGLFEKYE